MIASYKTAGQVLLAGNKIEVEATGDKMYITTGQVSKLVMFFISGSPVENDSIFTIAWSNKLLTIHFVTNPDNSLFEFRYTDSINTSWIFDFANFLRSIYSLETDFNFDYSTWPSMWISLKGRVKDSYYSIVTGGTPPYSYKQNLAAITPEVRQGYKLVFQVKNSLNVLLGEETITPDEGQKATFDLSEYIWNWLAMSRENVGGFTFPPELNKITEHPGHSVSFFVKYAEMWDAQVQNMKFLDSRTALMGGLSTLKEAEYAVYGTSFAAILDEESFFLTWQPVTKRTSLSSPERLYFYNNTTRTIYLRFKLYFMDGTDSTTPVTGFLTKAATAGNIYELDVSGSIFPKASSPIEKYEVWLETTGNVIVSEVRTYTIDYTFYRNEQHFIFRNSLGEYDTMRCTGRLRRQSEIGREFFTNDDDERQPITNLLDATYVAETGSIPGDHARWLEDMMLSKEVYWLLNSRAVPVIITSKKMNEIADDQRRFNLSFEYSIASMDVFYSMPKSKPFNPGLVVNTNNNTIIDA